jgi:predicted amidohydrolase
MKIALVQTNLHWQQPVANRAMLEEKLANLTQLIDLLILPEMFTTGFSMDTSAAEASHVMQLKWMQQLAKQGNMAITGSVMTKLQHGFVNRLYWVQPDGTYFTYDKRHLFRMASEHEHYQPGTDRLLVNWRGFNFCPLICYDLRFPVWSRNVNLEYDVLLYVANWPQARVQAWTQLLKARAIENLCYCLGVNRIGSDGNGIVYNGQSACYDFKGDTVLALEDHETIEIVDLDIQQLKDYRAKFPAHLDQDQFILLN